MNINMNIKRKTLRCFAGLLALCFAGVLALAGCPNPLESFSEEKSAAPTADVTVIPITGQNQLSVDIPLTSTHTGAWKIYDSEGRSAGDTSVFFASSPSPRLSLSRSVPFTQDADYRITVTEPGKTESDPLMISLRAPSAAPALADPLAAVVELTSAEQTSVEFTLAAAITGETSEWKVYDQDQGGAPSTAVSVTVSGTTLTLAAIPQGSPLAGGTYYVGVSVDGNAESARLALTINPYDPNRTTIPVISNPSFVKLTKPNVSVDFTLTNSSSYTGTAVWTLYASADGAGTPEGVSLTVSGNTLTLAHGTEIPTGTYYVTATEPGKTESSRQALGVSLPETITFTVGSSSVNGTASPGGGSVSVTTSGSPSYAQVNNSGYYGLTFNANTTDYTDGDFISVDPIAAAYIPEDNWTLELIVKVPSTGGQILSFAGPTGRSIWPNPGQGFLCVENQGYLNFVVQGTVYKGQQIQRPSADWHHLSFVKAGTGVTIYVDGVVAAPHTNNLNPNPNYADEAHFKASVFDAINSCLIGTRKDMQFHQFKISRSAITPESDSAYYDEARALANTLTGAKTDTPQVSSSTYTKTESTQAAAAFTLSNTYTGAVTWKVYASATGDTLAAGVAASLSGSTLTLAHASDIPAGNYYVSAAEAGKSESDRLPLSIVNYDAPQTATPAVSQTGFVKVTKPTAQAAFTLTGSYSGSTAWRLYTANTGETEWEGVTASSSGTTLTLAGTDVPVGTYYVSAAEPGKTESGRLALTVTLPDSITFTVGSNSVTGTASSGGSVNATVNGSMYGPVNGSSYYGLTISSASDYVSLNPIVGAYMPENWTLELIVKSPAPHGQFLKFFGSNGVNNAGSLWIEHNSTDGGNWLTRFYKGSGSHVALQMSRPSADAWHHVAYVRNGDTVTVYVDGTSIVSNTGFNEVFANAAFAQITNCEIGYLVNTQFHHLRISKAVITPDNNAERYNEAKVLLNTLNGVKTATPQASVTTYTKTQTAQAAAAFTLTNSSAYSGGPVTWKVYTADTGDTTASGVAASLGGSTLTLAHGSDIPAAVYYVAATEPGTGKLESDRLALTVAAHGAQQTATPTVSSAGFAKVAKPTVSAAYTLTNLTSGTITWKVYTTNEGSTTASGVTASSSGSTLTLAGTDVPAGTYYVSATEQSKTESGRLALTVSLPDSITFTVGSNSVTGTASPGGSVSATVNGSPAYGPVNNSAYYGLTFNSTTTTANLPAGTDAVDSGYNYVSLNPIAGDYMPEDNWTMELIVKTNTATNGQILNFWGPNGRNAAGSFWIEYHPGGGYWLFRVWNAQGVNKGVKTYSPSADAWHHVAYVRTDGTVTCYVDGVQATDLSGLSQNPDVTNTNPNATFNAAANTYFENPAMAQITNCLIGLRKDMQFHQFKISKTAITPSGDASYYNSAKGIVTDLNSKTE